MFRALQKVVAIAIAVGGIVMNVVGTASADHQVNLFVNQNMINSEQPAYFEEISKTTYVPLRAAVEALNGIVNWDNDSQVITLDKNGKIVKLQIGSDKVLIDGKESKISSPVKLVKETNRSLVPLNFFSDVLQCEVKISATAGVGIFDEKQTANN